MHAFRRPFSLIFAIISFLAITFMTTSAHAQKNKPTPTGSYPATGMRFVQPNDYFQLSTGVKTASLYSGAYAITQVTPGSPAANAGIRPGDIILGVSGKRACGGSDLPDLISAAGVGAEVPITFVRNGEIQTVKVRTVNRPDFDPEFAVELEVLPKITVDWQRSAYKDVQSECRRFREENQVVISAYCGLAHYNRGDWKKADKLFEMGVSVCPKCPDVYANQALGHRNLNLDYMTQWNTSVQLMNEYVNSETQAFATVDRQVMAEMKVLADQGQTQAALDRYMKTANEEAGCRGLPPSPALADLVVKLASKLNPSLAVPDAARHKMELAQTKSKTATDEAGLYQAMQLWVGAIWLAPWRGEMYARTADAMEKVGMVDEALVMGKRAFEMSRAGAQTTAATAVQAEPEEAITNPQETLRRSTAEISSVEKGSAEEHRLRMLSIRAALKMNPPPEPSEDAQRHVARGQAAMEMAQSKSDFGDAATEFENAVRVAPWWPDGYRGLGMANEKAGSYESSIAAYKLYLAAAPGAADAKDIQNKIFKLEYALERDQKQAVQQLIATKENALRIKGLEGLWKDKETGLIYSATVENGMFIASRRAYKEDGWSYGGGEIVLKGAIKGNTLEGTAVEPAKTDPDSNCSLLSSEQPLTGTISDDGKQITVKYQKTIYSIQRIKATLFTEAKCLKLEKLRDDLKIKVLEKQ